MEGGQHAAGAVLANSFPESGTHLLVQVLEALPGVRNYDSFVASVPPIRFREHRRSTLRRRIRWIAPSELVSGHLFYDPELAALLASRGVTTYFIYRDLRDVVVSEAHYLTYMNRWHRAHRYFASLPSDDERILVAIMGIPRSRVDFDFPDVGSRFARYREWLHEPSVCAVRFEDLATAASLATIHEMVSFYFRMNGRPASAVEAAAAACQRAIRPGRSRTFRRGEVGGHRQVFTQRHYAALQEVAGDVLEELGYE